MVEEVANQIIQDLKVENPPVKVSEVASHLKCEVIDCLLANRGAVCFPQSNLIGVQASLPRYKRRFAAMLMLAHILLGHRRDLFEFEFSSKDEEEASRLATALLVPKIFLVEELEKRLPESELDIARLAHKFDVDYALMSRRIEEVYQDEI